MSKPFEKDTEEEKSLEEVVDGGLKIWHETGLQSVVKSLESLVSAAKAAEEGNVVSLAYSLITVAEESYQFLDNSIDSYKKSDVWTTFVNMDSGHVIDEALSNMISDHISSENPELVMRDTPDEEDTSARHGPKLDSLYRLKNDEVEVYWVSSPSSMSSIVCKNLENVAKARDFLSSIVWKSFDNYIDLQVEKKSKVVFDQKPHLKWKYEGDQGERLIERWVKYYEANVRRAVILHGVPGTGKSTLARQIASRLDGKTLFIPVSTILKISSIHTLKNIISFLSPDVLIIDDIDRLGSYDLEKLLNFLEETEMPVPFIVSTTNDIERVPDAMKRPGRFDEIWEIQPPTDEIRIRLIKYLASLEDLELSDTAAKRINEVSSERNLPGSHIREIIRRVKVEGEEALDFSDNDLTFSPDWVNRDVVMENTGEVSLKPTEHMDSEPF